MRTDMSRKLNFESLETRNVLTGAVPIEAPVDQPAEVAPPVDQPVEVSEFVTTQQGIPTAADLKAQSDAFVAQSLATSSVQIMLQVKNQALTDKITALTKKVEALEAPWHDAGDFEKGNLALVKANLEFNKGRVKEATALTGFKDGDTAFKAATILWNKGEFTVASAKYIVAKINFDLAAKDAEVANFYFAKSSIWYLKAAFYFERSLSL